MTYPQWALVPVIIIALGVLVTALVIRMKQVKRWTAMCPRCRGEGCDVCLHGQIEVTIPKGDLYTLKCRVCGYENGGRIVNPDLPPLPEVPDIGCVECDAPPEQCYYKKVGRS